MSFFHTTEFYVILFLAAAAILAYIVKPHSATAASEHLIGSILSNSLENAINKNPVEVDSQPSISINCDDNGCVWLQRNGISGIDASGAVSAKIIVKDTNITIYERLCEGRFGDTPIDTAIFELDFLRQEQRYWLRYESEATNSFATLSFRNTPGYHAQSVLKQ